VINHNDTSLSNHFYLRILQSIAKSLVLKHPLFHISYTFIHILIIHITLYNYQKLMKYIYNLLSFEILSEYTGSREMAD